MRRHVNDKNILHGIHTLSRKTQIRSTLVQKDSEKKNLAIQSADYFVTDSARDNLRLVKA